MYNDWLVSSVFLLITVSKLSADDGSQVCSAKHHEDIYYWENWLDIGPRNSNNGHQSQCRSRIFLDQLESRMTVSRATEKQTAKKGIKKLKGSKKKQRKEKRKKQKKLKKERLNKKNEVSKLKHIKDTYD